MNELIKTKTDNDTDLMRDDINAARFHNLLNEMRSIAAEHGFMSDDEINTEIRAARNEINKATQ